MTDLSTPRPWRVFDCGPPGKLKSIISPGGDAELGNWMVAERVRWPGDAALIVKAVNLHDVLVASLRDIASHEGHKSDAKDCLMQIIADARAVLARVDSEEEG